jgi:hypothetical protein
MSALLRYGACVALPAAAASIAMYATGAVLITGFAGVIGMVLALGGSWLSQRAAGDTAALVRAVCLSLIVRVGGALLATFIFLLIAPDHARLAGAVIGSGLAAAIICEALTLLLGAEPHHA